jgi:hypothetical protein
MDPATVRRSHQANPFVLGKLGVWSRGSWHQTVNLDPLGEIGGSNPSTPTNNMNEDLVTRLLKRAEIRRQIPTRKSVQEGQPDRIADLLEEAANEIHKLRCQVKMLEAVDTAYQHILRHH